MTERTVCSKYGLMFMDLQSISILVLQIETWKKAKIVKSDISSVHCISSVYFRKEFCNVGKQMPIHINDGCLSFQQGLCFNGSAFVLYLIAAIVDASSVTKDLENHNYNSWAASSVS